MTNDTVRIGVLAPAEIAYRRFMPALSQVDGIEYAGVAVASTREWAAGGPVEGDASNPQERNIDSLEKAHLFCQEYGGQIYDSGTALLQDSSVEAVYIPLPPSLHFSWGKAALRAGKHVMMEKPFTISLDKTCELIRLAQKRGLAVHENYMFAFHEQISFTRDMIASGRLGDLRMLRVDFGFPFRGATDFRYNKELGGGALFDCGGYPVKLAALLLGSTTQVLSSQINSMAGFDVDIFGSATLVNDCGQVAQVAWGMDNDYRCNLNVWGSKASLSTGRILTAPADFSPKFVLSENSQCITLEVPADDSFKKSIEHFLACIVDEGVRLSQMDEIRKQGELVDKIILHST